MATPAIQTLITDAQQVLNLKSLSEIRATMAAALANANVGTPLNPNLTTQQLWDQFYLIVRQPESDIESIITNQLMKFLFAPPAPGGVGGNHEVIYNNNGVLAGDPKFLWDPALNKLDIDGSATITGDLTVRTNKLAVTSSGVGFGTTTPAYPAHFRTTSPVIAIQDDTSAATGVGGVMNFLGFTSGTSGANIFAQIKGVKTAGSAGGEYQVFTSDSAGNSIQRYLIDSTGISTWSVAGTTAMTLNSTGLGIGVVPSAWYSPYSVLQVGIGASISSFNSTYYDNIQLACNYFANSSGADRYINNGYATQYFQYNGSHIFRIAGNNTSGANQALTWTQAMTLDASGNLLVASGVIRAAGRTQIGSGYIGDISGTGNNIGVFFGSTGLLPANGSGTTSDNTSDLGSATARWDTVFAGTGTINTSDRNEKQDISDLSASEKRVASSIKQLVKKYRFKDAVASKGENARIHVGWIAQDIQSAFAAEGLDASDYGMFCSDTWEENGVEKTRLGLRYDEVLAFVVSAI